MARFTRILPNEHVFIAGKTGSGKSYLAERYLAGFKHVVMLDTKGEMYDRFMRGQKPLWIGVDDDEVTLVTRIMELEKASTPKIIYSPDYKEMKEEYYDAFFEWCYLRRNCIVWVDEAMSVSPNPHRIPEHYMAILTRGRSRNTAVWSLTQRPKGIANVIMSEATHFFIFTLQLLDDRKKIVDITGVPEFLEPPPKHVFWYWKQGMDRAILARLTERG